MDASPLPSLLCALGLAACSSASPVADAAFQERSPRERECCAGERARDLPGPGEPGGHDLAGDGLIVPVTPTLPALSFGAPVPVDENGGHEPRLFVEGGQLFVFHRAGSGQSLLLRRRPVVGGSFTPTQTVFASGAAADLIRDAGDHLLLVASAQSTRLLRGDGAGAPWTLEQSFAIADSAFCSLLPTASFFRPLQADLRIALGYSHDTKLFGCQGQGRWAHRTGAAWSALQGSFKYFPSGAFALGSRFVVGSSFSIAWSDDGVLYQEVPPDGSGTGGQLRAYSMALAPGPSLAALQVYNWASQHHLELLRSSDGKAWSRLLLRRQTPPISAPQLAVDGPNLAVLWESGAPQLIHSPDGGASWSAPASLPSAPASLALSGKRALVAVEAGGAIHLHEASW